jgi:aminoglycoside 3-N-acetyltransferase
MYRSQKPYTQGQLMDNLQALGIVEGQVLMLHGSVRAVGPVMGGPNTILQALLEVLGDSGTLMMYVGWEDIPDFVLDLPEDLRQLYYAEFPAFDPATSRAVRDNSILAEFLRTWPGAYRSENPEASIVAVGAQAEAITRDHPLDYGYGPGSPLGKLIDFDGAVLMLGAPLDTITLLHYAENRALMANKNIVRYQCPILQDGLKVWVDIEDYDTGTPHASYSFEQIALHYLTLDRAREGIIGSADSYLFNARDLTDFAITWLEQRYG